MYVTYVNVFNLRRYIVKDLSLSQFPLSVRQMRDVATF